MSALLSIRFLDGGFCLQNEWLIGAPNPTVRKFHAVFVHGRHPKHGEFLIDTGYGPSFYEATQRMPERWLRWLTFVPEGQHFCREDYWQCQGIDVRAIQNIFITHFHPDHIAALRCFPHATMVYRHEILAQLWRMSRLRRVFHGFLKQLIPVDIERRSRGIAEQQFVQHGEDVVPTFDVWGDRSFVLLDLPGHALGHTGVLMEDVQGPILYVVDAFWDHDATGAPYPLPSLTRALIHSYSRYKETIENIKALADRKGVKPIACHATTTERLFQG